MEKVKYIRPIIREVELRSDQAVLQVCSAYLNGGAWMQWGGTCYYNVGGGAVNTLGSNICSNGMLRGQLTTGAIGVSSVNNAGS